MMDVELQSFAYAVLKQVEATTKRRDLKWIIISTEKGNNMSKPKKLTPEKLAEIYWDADFDDTEYKNEFGWAVTLGPPRKSAIALAAKVLSRLREESKEWKV